MRTYRLRDSVDPASFRVDYRKELNEEQYRAVTDGEGACLVLAGAGSGKTRTIVYRVAYLLERGVRPEEILLVTFTNKAAREMLTRVEELLGAFPQKLWGGTFHHVANLLLRRTATAIGYKPSFTILDEEDSRDLIAASVKAAGIDPKQRRFPSPAVLQGIVSFSRNAGVSLNEAVIRKTPTLRKIVPDVEAVAERYEERKRQGQLMDFDDLLLNLLAVLKQPTAADRVARQFRYILVDEYQDTNRAQADIVDRLAAAHGNLFVVGDDSQSIYSFRGADIANILEFPKRHPEAKVFKLETNYRSSPQILSLANDVISQNERQYEKVLKAVRPHAEKPQLVPAATPGEEAMFVAQRILDLTGDGRALRDIAVLFRATHHSQALEFELTRRDIPYEYRGGLRFFERAHVKDVLAFLKLLTNPHDEVAWLRTLRLHVGVGPATASSVSETVRKASDPLAALAEPIAGVDARGRVGLQEFRSTVDELRRVRDRRPEALLKRLLRGNYRDYLVSEYPNADERLADLEQLVTFAARYDELPAFLADVSLQESFGIEGIATVSSEDDRLVLSTIHQAKGLEWDSVFLINLTASALPNPKALAERGGLEEERRLFYVAVTRAKRFLVCSYPYASDVRLTDVRLQAPSPFLTEVSSDVLEPLRLEREGSEPVIDLDREGDN